MEQAADPQDKPRARPRRRRIINVSDVPAHSQSNRRALAELRERQEKMLRSLKEHLCIVVYACEAAGVPRGTYYRWFEEDRHFRRKVLELRGIRMAFGERKLFELAQAGDYRAVNKLLECGGGYGPTGWISPSRVEVTGANGGPVTSLNATVTVGMEGLRTLASMPKLEQAVEVLARRKAAKAAATDAVLA